MWLHIQRNSCRRFWKAVISPLLIYIFKVVWFIVHGIIVHMLHTFVVGFSYNCRQLAKIFWSFACEGIMHHSSHEMSILLFLVQKLKQRQMYILFPHTTLQRNILIQLFQFTEAAHLTLLYGIRLWLFNWSTEASVQHARCAQFLAEFGPPKATYKIYAIYLHIINFIIVCIIFTFLYMQMLPFLN